MSKAYSSQETRLGIREKLLKDGFILNSREYFLAYHSAYRKMYPEDARERARKHYMSRPRSYWSAKEATRRARLREKKKNEAISRD